MDYVLISSLVAAAVISFVISPRVRTVEGFFGGVNAAGQAPSLWTLVLSQVTTWIFARSLLNAAILGFYYGIGGTLAYAAYYLSFLTGMIWVDQLRFRYGYSNIQGFLHERFGRLGDMSFNVVVAVRLLSEVFANLLVVGIIFGVAGTIGYTLSIIAIAVITLGYSMMGGLRASLRTDVLQAILLLTALSVLVIVTIAQPNFAVLPLLSTTPDLTSPGWVLLLVAFVQVWSYSAHDPVMMDRGFLADRSTTKWSFIHAAWISILAIIGFGLLGVYAGANKLEAEEMLGALTRLLGEPAMIVLNFALVISAISTLDSTFSSASKLVVADMKIGAKTTQNGRLAMLAFFLGGLLFVFYGSKDLFDAVAVSGSASMFLAPVLLFSVLGNARIAPWSFLLAFIAAMAGAVIYFLESSGYSNFMTTWFGFEHKYTKLLVLSLFSLMVGCIAFALSARKSPL